MGSGASFDAGAYHRSATGAAAAAGHSTRSASSTAAYNTGAIVPKLSCLHKNKAGQIIRESRDSDTTPVTTPIAVFLDVTGSNKDIAEPVLKTLPTLMATLVAEQVVPGPQVLFGAIGDFEACRDRCFQAGQFENGLEVASDLADIVPIGMGGGNGTESYDFAMWFMAQYAALDSLEKRGKKGYFFLICDESTGNGLKADHWNSAMQLSSDDPGYLKADVPMEQVVEALSEKFDICIIYPTQNGYFKSRPQFINSWKNLLPEQVYECEDADSITAFITGLIGMKEGIDLTTIQAKMKVADPGNTSIDVACQSLTKYEGTIVPGGKGGGIITADDPSGHLDEKQ